MASFLSLVNSGDRPTPFGVYDDDDHFQEEADNIILYVKRKLGDDVMSVELTSKQIWANFEEAVLVYSKQLNAHQAESYISNLFGLNIGPNETFKKNSEGKFVDSSDVVLNIQDTFDPRFVNQNSTGDGNPGTASPVAVNKIGPNGRENQFPRETLEYLVRRSEPYASEAAVGGSFNSIRGYIELKTDKQDYNIYDDMIIPGDNDEKLKLISYDSSDPNTNLSIFNPAYKDYKNAQNAQQSKIKIQEIFHFSPQAAYRFFDTTSAINYLNNQFAFESFTPETVFYVLPVFEDLLRAGQLDISNRVRRSNYSYKLQGQDLRIYPNPTSSNPMNLFIKFTFPADPYKPSLPYDDNSLQGVSNISNVPFGNIPFKGMNAMSRQWIRQYTLALCKETLGLIRSKFGTVPIPGGSLQLNGSDLLSQAAAEKDKLSQGLGDTLDKLTYQKIIESDAAQSESMRSILKNIPVPNGRAIIMG